MSYYEIMQTIFLLIMAGIVFHAVNRINKSGDERIKSLQLEEKN